MTNRLHELDYIKLERTRAKLLYKLAEVDIELAERRQQNRKVIKVEEQAWFHTGDASGMKLDMLVARLVTPELGFNVYNMTSFVGELPPGYQEGAYHTHGEAIKYYLSGEGEEDINGERVKVKAGDCAFIPANVWHGTQNTGSEPLRFFAVAQFQGTHLQVPTPRQVREDLRIE